MSTDIPRIDFTNLELIPGNPGETWSKEKLEKFNEEYAVAVEEAFKDAPRPVRFHAIPFYLR